MIFPRCLILDCEYSLEICQLSWASVVFHHLNIIKCYFRLLIGVYKLQRTAKCIVCAGEWGPLIHKEEELLVFLLTLTHGHRMKRVLYDHMPNEAVINCSTSKYIVITYRLSITPIIGHMGILFIISLLWNPCFLELTLMRSRIVINQLCSTILLQARM